MITWLATEHEESRPNHKNQPLNQFPSQVSTGVNGHGPQFDMQTGFPRMGRKT
jgi:hypothetical protein